MGLETIPLRENGQRTNEAGRKSPVRPSGNESEAVKVRPTEWGGNGLV